MGSNSYCCGNHSSEEDSVTMKKGAIVYDDSGSSHHGSTMKMSPSSSMSLKNTASVLNSSLRDPAGGSDCDLELRIVLVGDSFCGKSALVMRFGCDAFNEVSMSKENSS